MRELKTNTAIRLTVGPFFDKTDGVTPETALTVTGCKLTLMVDVAGVPTLVLDTAPTASGGANDMVHVTGDDAGFYDLELAAANLNYLGPAILAITDGATHCPVVHELMIITAAEHDRKYGSGLMDVNVTKVGGTTQTARDLGASVLVGDKTGFSLSAGGVQAIWDALSASLTTANSIGKRLVDYVTGDTFGRLGAPAGASVSADVAAIKTVVDTISTAAAAIKVKTDQMVFTIANKLDSSIQAAGDFAQAAADKVWSTAARVLTAGTNIVLAKGTGVTGFNDPTAAANASAVRTELTTELGRIDTTISSRLATAGYTAPDNATIVNIDAKTTNLPTDPADQSLLAAATDAILTAVGTVPTAVQNADALLGRNQQGGSNTAPTVAAALAGGLMSFAIVGSTLTVKHGDGTTAYTRTLSRAELDAITTSVAP